MQTFLPSYVSVCCYGSLKMTFYTGAFRTFWCRIEGLRIVCNKGKSRGCYPSKPVTALKPHNMCVDMVPDQDYVNCSHYCHSPAPVKRMKPMKYTYFPWFLLVWPWHDLDMTLTWPWGSTPITCNPKPCQPSYPVMYRCVLLWKSQDDVLHSCILVQSWGLENGV